jgi:ribose-phosphate pyrophosphokinase
MKNDIESIRIFAGSSATAFVSKMCRYLRTEPGRSEVFNFKEGNTYVKILENVRRKDIFLVQTIGLNANDSFVELLFWIDAFKRASADSVTVILPYFSYAKADKKDEPRVSIRARVCADCIETSGADRIITIDLHSPQIQGFFKVPVDHLYSYPLLCEYIKTLNISNLVVVSPDTGFAKTARKIASHLNVPAVICDKMRRDHSGMPEVLEIFGTVKNKNALIVDDFTITAGTLTEAAKALKSKGAKNVFAMVTHTLIDRAGMELLMESPINQLITTDTVYNTNLAANPRFKVVSVAPLMAEAVRIIQNRGSVSSLFDQLSDKIIHSSF